MSAGLYAAVTLALLGCALLMMACRSWAARVASAPAPARAPRASVAVPVAGERPTRPVSTPSAPTRVTRPMPTPRPAPVLPPVRELGALGDLSDLEGRIHPADVAWLRDLLGRGGQR